MLFESIHDTYKKVAVFFAGAPGSGKTTIAKTMFHFEDTINLSPYGAKRIDPDIYYERKMKAGRSDRNYSRVKRDEALEYYTNESIPVIVDGTGRNAVSIIWQAKKLKEKDYDVYMIFVSSGLKTSLKRNEKRERHAETDFIKQVYDVSKKNKGLYKEYFGNKFYEINNNQQIDIDSLHNLGRKIMSEKK